MLHPVEHAVQGLAFPNENWPGGHAAQRVPERPKVGSHEEHTESLVQAAHPVGQEEHEDATPPRE